MKYRVVLVLLLLGALAVGVSAQPRGGMAGPMGAHGPMGAGGMFGGQAEEVELSGQLRLAAGELPVLVSGGTEYVLRIMPVLAAEFDARSGQQVTVAGYLSETRSRDLLTTTRSVMVRSIQIGGTTYVVPGVAGGPARMRTAPDVRGRGRR
ncbi:MAG: hypothetical protein EA382_19415 [Spirochaetaceae bacterium]|nr:MAG: hypothetical protein EA382_19415 [Spirochaetaceae bacterium]